MTEPRVRSLSISFFVDANHAGTVVTTFSNNVIITFIQNTPLIWFSKRHNTVVSDKFGSNLVAPRI